MTISPPDQKVRRSRQPAATRERLIKAAFEVVSERGFEAATTDEIVRRAGLTNGALYNLFSSKNELLATALEYEIATLQAAVAAMEDSPGDTVEKIQQIVRAWRKVSPGEGGVMVEILARARRDKMVSAIYLRLADAIEAALTRELRRGQESGQVRSDLQPEAIARLLTSIGTGYQAQVASGRQDIDRDAWIAVLEHVIESLHPRREVTSGELV